jgi:hypothetical protein
MPFVSLVQDSFAYFSGQNIVVPDPIIFYDTSNLTSYSGGTTIVDLKSNSDGNLINSPSYTSTYCNSYITLDSNSNQSIDTDADISSFYSGTSTSIFMWIYPITNGVILVENSFTGWIDSQIELVNGTLYFGIWNGSNISYFTSNIPTPLNEWCYIGFVYDELTTTLTGYINDQVAGSIITQRDPPYYNASSLNYSIGGASSTNMGDGGYGNFNFGSFEVYNVALTQSQVKKIYNSTSNKFRCLKSGIDSSKPGKSAYQIKTNYPLATDGLYWISIPEVNSGQPFQIYADMTTDGGGWTLILQNNYSSWSDFDVLLKNYNTPPETLAIGLGTGDTQNYSILVWADNIKKSPSGFQYMIDANTRGYYGGIWTVNEPYSFIGQVDNTQYGISGSAYFGTDPISGNNGFRQNITLKQKFPIVVLKNTIDAFQYGNIGSSNSDIIIDSSVYTDIVNVPMNGTATITSNEFVGTKIINYNYDTFSNGKRYIRFQGEAFQLFYGSSSTFHIEWNVINQWNYNNSGIEKRMPWYSDINNYRIQGAILTTTHDDDNSWWGTLVASSSWYPAPWQSDVNMPDPGVIWYWVR